MILRKGGCGPAFRRTGREGTEQGVKTMRERNGKLVKCGRITILRILPALTLIAAAHGLAQVVSAQGVVLFRNVQIADANGVLANRSVLIVSGKITRVDRDLPTPVGATVIDGGGNVLSVADDGTIKLSSPSITGFDKPVSNLAAADAASGSGDTASYRLNTPESSPKNVDFNQAVYAPPKPTRRNVNSLAGNPAQQGPH